MKYTLPDLPFAYDALEPWIDKATMKVHHDGHHKAYVDKLNKALANYPAWQIPMEELLTQLDRMPKEIQAEVRNNGGGHANHTLFWSILTPKAGKLKDGDFSAALGSTFGSYDAFTKEFAKVAINHFSNGWAWLSVNKDHVLSVHSTRDHESPLTKGLQPLLVLDLWEHAYYLKHQIKRADYIKDFWNVVNWAEIETRWNEIKMSGHSNREWALAA